MNILKLIEGFVYGEISPYMAGQVDSKAYKQSAKDLCNMFPDPRGPAVGRPGATLIHRKVAEACKLTRLQVSPSQSYIIMLTNLKATIIANDVHSHKPNLLANGVFKAGGLSWVPKAVGRAKVEFGYRKTLLKPGKIAGETVRIHQSIQLADSSLDYVFKVTGLFRGPTVAQAVKIQVGTSMGGHQLADVNLYGDYTFQGINITAPGADTIFVTVTALDWSATTGTDTESYLESMYFHAVNASTPDVELVSPYTDGQLKDIHVVRVYSANKIILLHKDVPPQELFSDDLVTWKLQDIAFTDKPATWTAGSFPTTVTFYEGRAVWGGVMKDQETFVMSKTFDHYVLTTGTNPDNAFSFTINHEGLISWIIGSKALLIGTINGEYKVTSSEDIMMPGTIQVDLQSAHGSSPIQPILVGAETVFPTVDGRALRAMFYFWEDDGWVAEDLSFATNHITYSGIKELVAATNPEPILWCVLNDGGLAGCSYQFQNTGSSKDKRVTGWHRHVFNAPVLSMTTVEDYGYSMPLVALKVEVEGVNEIHLCYLDLKSEQAVFLDDAITWTSNTPATVVTGLDHLEGYEVDILADGATHALKTVVGGQITLDEKAQYAEVGLPYTCRLVTQPAVLATKEGTIKHQLGRWSEAYIYILDSALPLIDGVRAEEFEARSRMGYKQDRITGYTNSTQFGWERDSVLTIEQDLPFPLVISHIAGELEK